MRPIYQISVDGRDVTAQLQKSLVSIGVADEEGTHSDTLTIKVKDDGSFAAPRHGAVIDIALGYIYADSSSELVVQGQYQLDEYSYTGPPDILEIVASGQDFIGTWKEAKTRSFDALSLLDIFNTIAVDNGLTPRIHPSVAAIQVQHWDQVNQSDKSLSRALARHYDLRAVVKQGHLVVLPRALGQDDAAASLPAVPLSRNQHSTYRAKFSEVDSYNSVRARWHNLATGKEERELVGEGRPRYTLDKPYPSKDEALRAANAKLSELKRIPSSLELSIVGNPNVMAERPIVLSGYPRSLDGVWNVSRCNHVLDEGGFKTKLTASKPS